MGKLEQVNKIISDMEKLRLQIKHEVDSTSKVYNSIYEYGRKAIWEEYGRGHWYVASVSIFNGEPQSFDDWLSDNYREFPKFMSADDFCEVFATELADKYNEECKKAMDNYEQEQS